MPQRTWYSGIKLRDLRNDAVNVDSRAFDFGQGYAEKWDVVQPQLVRCEEESDHITDLLWYVPSACPKCGAYVETEAVESDHEHWQEPMMNYWHPLPDRYQWEPNANALALSPFAMCVVQDLESEDYGLALTGGGMDLSWDIAGAYIIMGYLPPAHIRLPQFAGNKLIPGKRLIVAALRKSIRLRIAWAKSDLRDLTNTVAYMRTGK